MNTTIIVSNMHAKQEYTDHKNIDASMVKNTAPVDMFIDYGTVIFCHGSYLSGSSLTRRMHRFPGAFA